MLCDTRFDTLVKTMHHTYSQYYPGREEKIGFVTIYKCLEVMLQYGYRYQKHQFKVYISNLGILIIKSRKLIAIYGLQSLTKYLLHYKGAIHLPKYFVKDCKNDIRKIWYISDINCRIGRHYIG